MGSSSETYIDLNFLLHAGIRYEDTVVLGRFCASVITLCLNLPVNKLMLPYSYEKMKQMSSESTKHDLFLVIFAGIASKLEKVGSTFSTFNPCPSE